MEKKRPIRLSGVRQNNLKNITVSFPAKQLTVVTGLSGSGKSSLIFDTLYAEGQRRYVESLSTYTRQFLEKMPKPELDSVENIPPAIALEQKNHVINSRSTVGSQTEIVDYLRLLYAKIGQTQCLNCGGQVRKQDSESLLQWALKWLPGKKAIIAAPLTQHRPTPGKGKKKTKLAPGTLASLFQLLREQGFHRVLAKKTEGSHKTAIQLDLQEIVGTEAQIRTRLKDEGLSNPSPEDFWIIVDRMKLSTPTKGEEVDSQTRTRILDSVEQGLAIGQGSLTFVDIEDTSASGWRTFDLRYSCVDCGTEHRVPEPNLFSWNNPIGACPKCSGFGFTLDIDEGLVVPDPSKTLKNGAIDPFSKPSLADWQDDLFKFAEKNGISIGKRYRELTPAERKLLWEGDPEISGFKDAKKSKTFPGILACFEELKRWKYKLHIRVFIRRYQSQTLCTLCKGSRLKHEATAVKIRGVSIADVVGMPIADSLKWMLGLELTPTEKKISKELLSQVQRRFEFLSEVGVGYLTLSRMAKTLSGGEFQRICLATQLGNGLCGTLYILDEPSIGLHQADTQRLIKILKRLRDQGNTVVVVEHDLEVMRAADWLIELGPGAGRRGGELMAQGSSETLIQTSGSVTGKYLSGALSLSRQRPKRPEPKRWIKLTGCRENNLKNVQAEFPLDRLVVVTGVSGSGKSTLVHKTLFNSLSRLFYHTTETIGAFDRLYGAEQIGGVIMLDQSSIGKSSRSNPATYLKAWDEVRRTYANQVLSLRRGYTPQHFSFNVDGGRCPVCKGEGEITLDMHFMAEVKLPCEECEGKRFKKKVLDVTFRGKDISQLLNTTIDDAYEIFRDNSVLVRKFGILRDVGLGYLHVGQSGATLSGGESQRLKIASALDDRQSSNQLYIFDEPTTGLHLEDIKKLMTVMQDLIDAHHSVIVIEHHLDVIAQADWIMDMGPGGGANGGEVIASGPPHALAENPNSITGGVLLQQGYKFQTEGGREISAGLH